MTETALARAVTGALPPASITDMIADAFVEQADSILALSAATTPAEVLAQVGHRIKDIRAAIKAQTKPATELRRIATTISAPWLKASKRLEAAEKHVRQELARQRTTQVAEQKQRLAVAAVTGAPAEEIQRAAEVVSEAPEGVRFKTVTKWSAPDLSAVPDEFKILDTKKIDAAIKAGHVPPGVEVYTEQVSELRR